MISRPCVNCTAIVGRSVEIHPVILLLDLVFEFSRSICTRIGRHFGIELEMNSNRDGWCEVGILCLPNGVNLFIFQPIQAG